MAQFSYTVQNERGEMKTGILEAVDENEAVASLQGRGFFILALASEKAGSGIAKKLAGGGKVGTWQLIFFAEQLATLLNGGVPLVRALSLLAEYTGSKALHLALTQVAKDVSAGSALFKALEAHPKIFSDLWISLVQAGEMGGQLPKILNQIASYLASQAELKTKILNAMMLPAVLICMSGVVITVFIVVVVPKFTEIFKEFHMELPLLTRSVIAVSEFIVHDWMFIVIAGITGWLSWSAYVATEAGQLFKWRMILDMPMFGVFVNNILVERLLSTLSTLIESGVSILNAIAVLEGLFAKNIVFHRMLKGVKEDVAGGKSISGAFRRGGVLPPLVIEMMFMGEESGKLPEMLKTLATFFQRRITQFILRFTTLVEPLAVILIGVLVAIVVLAIYLPIFKLATMNAH